MTTDLRRTNLPAMLRFFWSHELLRRFALATKSYKTGLAEFPLENVIPRYLPKVVECF